MLLTPAFLIPCLLLATIAAVSLGLRLRSTKKLVPLLENRIEQLSGVQKKRGVLEAELSFLSSFLREFALLSRTLHADMRVREIPDTIRRFLVKVFDPEEAVVFVRRKASGSSPETGPQLIVASSTGKLVPLGKVIRAGHGKLGSVVEAKRAMDRNDLDAIGALQIESALLDNLGEFEADLAAPMMLGERTLGVIALSKPTKKSVYAKTVMDLISESAAMALNNAKAMGEIRSDAETDALTSVYNKGALTKLLEEAIAKAESQESALAVFLMDIDHFKNYNDTNGHLAGDELLRQLAALISNEVRSEDIFGRFGGEEFLLILPDRNVELGILAAENIRRRIANHRFPYGTSQPLGKLSISGGVAALTSDTKNSEEILKAADDALYKAKLAGRNRIIGADE